MNTEHSQKNYFFAVVVGLVALSFILLILPALFSSLWFVAFLCLVPLFFLIKMIRNPFLGATVATLIGIAYFLVVFYPLSTLNTWWWTVSQGFFWEHKQLLYLSICTLLALFCSMLTFGPIFFLYGKWLRNRPKLALISIFLLPAGWVFAEVIRVKTLFGLEWALLGQPLGNNLAVARMGVFGGIFMLSFLVVMVNVCVFQLIEHGFEKILERPKENKGAEFKKINVISIILLFLASTILINNHTLEQKNLAQNEFRKSTQQIALISPDLETRELAQPEGMEEVFSLIEEYVKHSTKNLIILPENIFPTIIIDENTGKTIDYKANLQTLPSSQAFFNRILKLSASQPQKTLILGLHTSKNGDQYNSMLVIEGGGIVSLYKKEHLLPFTEQSFSFFEEIHIEPLKSGTIKEKDGLNKGLLGHLNTQYGDFVPLICSESLISSDKLGKNNKNVPVINIGNDNIFSSPRAAQYNKIIVRVRAIEMGTPMIRVSKGGFSGIFDSTGREI